MSTPDVTVFVVRRYLPNTKYTMFSFKFLLVGPLVVTIFDADGTGFTVDCVIFLHDSLKTFWHNDKNSFILDCEMCL